jgi:hypothetical protein
VTDQLRLAYVLVTAVLKFNGTPWLPPEWDLGQIRFFGDHALLENNLFEHLHLVTNITINNPNLVVMEDVQSTGMQAPQPSPHDTLLSQGVRNLTLHSLGACLAQIGDWEFRDKADVSEIRRMAARGSRLGSRFHQIVQKCLYCDFGCGDDLKDPKLQRALCNDVVQPLDDMMKCLDIGTAPA